MPLWFSGKPSKLSFATLVPMASQLKFDPRPRPRRIGCLHKLRELKDALYTALEKKIDRRNCASVH